MTQVATAPIVTSVRNTNYKVSTDPYTIRWGFNPVLREKILEARQCGVSIFPFGSFFPITSFETVKEFHTTDETQPKENQVIIPAAEAEQYFDENFAGKNPMLNVPDWGFQVGFVGEEDAGKMAVISRVLLPDLPTIRNICAEMELENPIGAFCEGQDDLNFDERQTCPTCWFNWLASDACTAYASSVSKTGMKIIEVDEQGKRAERNVKPALKDFETARDLMIASFQKGLVTLEEVWLGIVAEVDEKVRKMIPPYQHNIRRDIHAAKPADRSIQVVQEYAKINAAGSGKMEDAFAMLAQTQAQLAQSQAQTNELLLKVLEKEGKK